LLVSDHVPSEPWLFKKIAGRWEAARTLWNLNDNGDQKQSPEKSCLPTAATLPSAMNGNFGTSPL
jgi:hypothetical protein